jgi:D-psicose/D-tagatose/L-ribulose 3-epimerase
VGESHRGALGTGTVDFVNLFFGLSEIDYAGPITFESFSSKVVSPQLSNTLCVWRDLWDDSEVLARGAKDYIEQRIESSKIAKDSDVEVESWF